MANCLLIDPKKVLPTSKEDCAALQQLIDSWQAPSSWEWYKPLLAYVVNNTKVYLHAVGEVDGKRAAIVRLLACTDGEIVPDDLYVPLVYDGDGWAGVRGTSESSLILCTDEGSPLRNFADIMQELA